MMQDSSQKNAKTTPEQEQAVQSKKRKLKGFWKHSLILIGAIMSLFHVYTVGFRPVSPWILFPVHVMFGIILVVFLYPSTSKSPRDRVPAGDLFLALLAVMSTLYIVWQRDTLVYRIGVSPTNWDIVCSSILVLLVLEATRRTTGLILPAIAIVFIAYANLGRYLPGFLGHRGYSWPRIISYLTGMDAMFSVPIAASATFVFLLVLFANFLIKSGAGQFFIDFSLALAGGTRGGPAKTAVVASALFGMITGNSAANVVSTGAFTIPLMQRIGYSPRFAAAVEAVASTGGQIMPPILGSAAFIMAQLLGIPYLRIMLAALLPALLYFLTVFIMIDLQAVKMNLKGLPREQLPDLKAILLQRGHLMFPILVLLYVLVVLRASPVRAGLWGILAAIAVAMIRKETRMSFYKIYETLSEGAQATLPIITACATAGLVIGVLNLVGAGLKFAGVVVALSQGILPVALVLSMAASIILGMGLPTTAAYLICAAVVTRALVQLNVTPLAAHMFVFYFACISAITPPVAVAAYAASGLTDAKPIEVALTACKLGIAAFIVPYMFVYDPSLLLEAPIGKICMTLVTSVIGTFALAMAIQGLSWQARITTYQRILLLGSALLLLNPKLGIDLIGLILLVVSLGPLFSKVKGFTG